MVKVVDAHKDQLSRRKPGALFPAEPKFIWVKMPNKPNGQSHLLVIHNKFNNILENLLANLTGHYIMDINKEVVQPENFSLNNVINDRGKECVWVTVDRLVESFDYHKEKIKPIPNAHIKPPQQVTPMCHK